MKVNAYKSLILTLCCLLIIYPSYTVSAYSLNNSDGQNTATIQIGSIPEEAIIYIDGDYIGTTPMLIAIEPGEHHLRVVLQGSPLYYEKKITILENEKAEIEVDFCSLAYSRIEDKNNIESLKAFIEDFPMCEQTEEAKVLICSSAFNEVEQEGTIESYEKFIDEYPDCIEQVNKAEYRIKLIRGEQYLEQTEDEGKENWQQYNASKSKARKVGYSGLAIIAGAVGLAYISEKPEYEEYREDLLTAAKISFWIGTAVSIVGFLWSLAITKPTNTDNIILKIDKSPFSKDFTICKFQNKNIRVYLGYRMDF
jgi:hypothetical protein